MIPVYKDKEIAAFLKHRDDRRETTGKEVQECVTDILQDVRTKGDKAIAVYTHQFDKTDLSSKGLRVSEKELAESANQMPEGMMDIFREAADNIRNYHARYNPESWTSEEADGVILGQRVLPLKRIGIYAPGGRAAYPSSVLMAAIPAQAAGVREIAVASPPDREGNVHPGVLAVCHLLGIHEVYRIGGAQAIGGLAYGTGTIRPVDKIVGPGNMYVAEAKRQVFGICDIDMIAGPSEVVILADESADPDYIAADLLAQAEHDPSASSICVIPEDVDPAPIVDAVMKQAENLERQEILIKSLKKWSGILITKTWQDAIRLTNDLAAEHLGIHSQDPWKDLESIENAGAIFLGHYSPESVGDYWAGPNHILPTDRTARFSSPLGTQDFLKRSSLIAYTKSALQKNGTKITRFAKLEGLDGHANAIEQRLS